jgi:feruloyl-CoA synthase
MLCANQQQVAQAMTVMTEGPLVLVDWLPWSHTFGGNQNFGMVLYHGGSMYIDDGKPTASAISETLRNLREISPTVYFNVPIGFEMIAEAMQSDPVLRKNLMSRVKMFFYAAASMPQSVWNSLYESAELELGKRIVVASGLGMTETGPHCLFGTRPQLVAGELGLPAPGMEVKLIEVGDKTEIRYKGPNVTPGYWRAPEETTAHFDEEGFFCSGDAVKWTDQKDINRGLSFDGRLAEDFKLSTGTFVSVGPLRSKIINAGAPYIQDVVITGHSFKELGALVFPTPGIYSLSKLPADASLQSAIECEEVQKHFQNLMNELASASTGSASRIARMCLLADPPSLVRGELTDKGSINQRAVLSHRAQTVLRLHADDLPNIIKPKD